MGGLELFATSLARSVLPSIAEDLMRPADALAIPGDPAKASTHA
jgi:hypothetical protein